MARNSPKTSASGGAASAQPAPRRLCARPIGNGLPTYVLRGICRRRIRKRRRNLRTRHAAADVFPAFGSASGARTRQNANEFAFAPDLFVPLSRNDYLRTTSARQRPHGRGQPRPHLAARGGEPALQGRSPQRESRTHGLRPPFRTPHVPRHAAHPRLRPPRADGLRRQQRLHQQRTTTSPCRPSTSRRPSGSKATV